MVIGEIDYARLRDEIVKRGFNRVLIQLPEGLKQYATEIADSLGEFEVYIDAEPCYGACDVNVQKDKLTVQFGHSEIPNINYPDNVIFVELFSSAKFEVVVDSFLSKVNCERIGIVASVQHVKEIDHVKKMIEEYGRRAFVGIGDSRIRYPGQILGCNFSSARNIANIVDCFAFLGTGKFHALGVRITTGKRTYVLDPYTNRVFDVEDDADRFMRQRFGAIAIAEKAERFGIIISTKIGQRRERLALALKEMVENAGLKAYLLYLNNVRPEELYYEVDVYVNTSCPRVTYDDYLRFPKPVISPQELQIALKYRLWEQYSFDEIVQVD